MSEQFQILKGEKHHLTFDFSKLIKIINSSGYLDAFELYSRVLIREISLKLMIVDFYFILLHYKELN